jgi:hypothetical protein
MVASVDGDHCAAGSDDDTTEAFQAGFRRDEFSVSVGVLRDTK